MQNIILALVAVVLIGGAYFYFTSNTSTAPAADTMEADMVTPENNPMDSEAAVSTSTIVDLAVATPSLSTLVAAVVAADLADTLASAGPFTVFAPIDEAFAALPAGTVETLLLPENIADLQGILTYHVVSGAVMAGDLTDGMVVETVNGDSITINVAADGIVSINGVATVLTADVVASNGIVHVIDGVLLPSAE